MRMDLSCQVGAVEGSGRVEAAREQCGDLLAVKRLECNIGAAQQLDRLRGEPGERDLGEVGLPFARTQHQHDSSPLQRLRLAKRTQEAGVIEPRLAQAGRVVRSGVFDLLCLRP
jgi:hypothetical protein